MPASILRSLGMLLATTGLLVGTAAEGDDAPSQVGTWVHNPRESVNMPDPEGSETVEIRRYDAVLDYTWTGISKDGEKSTFSYSSPADGEVRELPGFEGLRGSMTRTPSGIIDAKLWFPDGSSEDKFCILTTPTRLTCFATYTDAAGEVSLFKQVFDKQ